MNYIQDGIFLIAAEGYQFTTLDGKFTCKKIIAEYLEHYKYGPVETQLKVDLWNSWQKNILYNVDDVCVYEGKRYKCLTAHVSQEGKTPENTLNLWIEI